MAVNIPRVAAHAGGSTATVSRILASSREAGYLDLLPERGVDAVIIASGSVAR